MTQIVSVRFKWRRDTSSNWFSANPVLLEGETGLELDTGKFKIGDGATAWNSLTYFESGIQGGSGGTTGLTLTGTTTLTLGGTLNVESGGTGATTRLGARINLGLGSIATKNAGASGTFTTADSKSVTVEDGIITSIA